MQAFRSAEAGVGEAVDPFPQLGDVSGVRSGDVQDLHQASGLEKSVTQPVAPKVRLPDVMLTMP